ncbi:MAG: O-antigen ligase family protein [Dehalococcoidales bacterium]|nr:O-antigen ligase family protein [Dehalococcoidales bacterium]
MFLNTPLNNRYVKIITAIQPFASAPIFFAVMLGNPPLWLAVLIAVLPFLVFFVLTDRLSKRTPFDIPIAIFFIGTIVGYLVSSDKSISANALYTTLACILLYYGLVNNYLSGRVYWLVMTGLGGVVVLGLTIWYFTMDDGRVLFFNRWLFDLTSGLPAIGGPVQTINWNPVGVFLGVVTILPVAVALFAHGLLRRIMLAVGIILLLLVALTASGSGFLTVICGVIVILALRWRMTLGLTIPSLGALIAFVALNYSRFAWPEYVFSVPSFLDRVDIWGKTLLMLKESPFTGLGLGQWLRVFPEQYGIRYENYANAHNSYLQLYADTGILGVIALVVAGIILVKMYLRVRKADRKMPWYGIFIGTVGGVVAGAVGSIFEVMTTGGFETSRYYYIVIPFLWVWAALLVVSFARLTASLPCTNGKQDLPRTATLK